MIPACPDPPLGNIEDYSYEFNCVFVVVMYVCAAQTSVIVTCISEQTCVMLEQVRSPEVTLCLQGINKYVCVFQINMNDSCVVSP